jgi:hypothetical protein
MLLWVAAAAWKPCVLVADQVAKVELDTMFPKHLGDEVLDENAPALLAPSAHAKRVVAGHASAAQ